MIRHIIAAIATLLALWAMAYMYQLDQKAERYKRIQELIERTKMEVKIEQNVQPVQPIEEPEVTAEQIKEEKKKEDEEIAKKLKSLRDRAGSAMAFKVSPMYKQKCSSCHGVNGEGAIGPKLIGKSESYVLKALEDFKSGKRKNYVMYGLLTKMSEDDLKALAQEIGTFEEKMKAAAE
jgi:cytochrome c553